MEKKRFGFNRLIASLLLALAVVGPGLSIGPVFGAYAPERYVPVGTIIAYAGATAPAGFLMCDGSSLLRLSYPALASTLGCSGSTCNFGAADTTHFNVPDLRGRFPRGTDNMGTSAGAASLDPDRASRTACKTGGNTGNTVGSCQGQATAKNGLFNNAHTHESSMSDGLAYFGFGSTHAGGINNGSGNNPSDLVQSVTVTMGSNDNETRPVNVSLNYIIKF